MSIFQALNESYVLMREGGAKLLPGVGRRSDCASAILMPSKESADDLITRIQEDCRGIFGVLKANKVDNLFALMRRASQEGIGAFDSAAPGFLENPLVFCNRPTEIGDLQPTLLSNWCCQEEFCVLARTGEKNAKAIDVVPWQRFDISDPLLSIWSKNGEPFRNWDSGDPMLGILIDGGIPVLRKCALTEHWASLEGTLPIFTTESDYEYAMDQGILNSEISLFGPFSTDGYEVYRRNYEQTRQTTYLQVETNQNYARTVDHGTRQNAISNITLFQITSLPDFIANVCSQLPILEFGQFSINPYCHRENSGYGWSSNLIAKRITGDKDTLRTTNEQTKKRCGTEGTFFTVGGVWTIESRNEIRLKSKSDRWVDNATLYWPGGASINLLGQGSSIAHKDEWKDFTNDEKKEEIMQIFEGKRPCEFLDEDDFEGLASQSQLFVAQLWDTITGEKFVLRVNTPYQFLAFLYQSLPEDERVRIYGARDRGSPVTSAAGSGNTNLEKLRTMRIQNALLSIAQDAAITGYSPDKILKICWVVNQLFETLHLDYAGYTQDLLIQCESTDDLLVLCESLNIEHGEALQFKDGASLIPPAQGIEILRDIIKEDDFRKIHPKSIYFAANGLLDLSHKGSSLNIDYSTSSIQFVKSLEVQLGDLYRVWLSTIDPRLTDSGTTRSSRDVKAYFDTNKMFTIGTMAYIFREVNESMREKNDHSSLASIPFLLASRIAGIKSLEPLLTKEFYKRFLNKVIHSYRNGGAHDQKIELSTCIECRDSILGTSASIGWLPIVASAAQDLKHHLEAIGDKS